MKLTNSRKQRNADRMRESQKVQINSLVSKKFRDLIQNHRHTLTLLRVDSISMNNRDTGPAAIKIFDKQLSPEAYNEWVIRNQYSKQFPQASQIAGKQSTRHSRNVYELSAVYTDSKRSRSKKSAFFAREELNGENWPLFQHFVCLLTDPFIHIRCVDLTSQNEVLNLLAEVINPDHNSLQCERLIVNLDGNSQKFITWIKDYVECDKLEIYGEGGSNCDKELLDFFVTGTHCTSNIHVDDYDLSDVVLDFVKKFMDLKKCDKHQCIPLIESNRANDVVDEMKRHYAEFVVLDEGEDDEKDDEVDDSYQYKWMNKHGSIETIFEFINNDVKKKLTFSATTFGESSWYVPYDDSHETEFSLDITNL
ncbi:hypothetical protein DdX_19853 [Ditylenchus destructor]|uniref:Uncharacterized protein n=1 Tax=Ditylenchus destructor TaxID=166010 RepID=A0AAD4MMG0_9BILA|nr:hypothetical protein DdX_19853 [Ditylenchus destructor]